MSANPANYRLHSRLRTNKQKKKKASESTEQQKFYTSPDVKHRLWFISATGLIIG